MRKLLSALTLTLLLAVNTLADANSTASVTEPPPADLSASVSAVLVDIIAIAIPNLLK